MKNMSKRLRMIIFFRRPRVLVRLAVCCLSLFSFLSPFDLLRGQGNGLRIEASFSPSSITLEKKTIYKLVIHGTQNSPKGSLPSVPGLKISNSPQVFRSASFRDGVPSVRLEMSFQVNANKTGTFTIPSWELKVDGKSLQAPPATLQVFSPNQEDLARQKRQEEQAKDFKQAAFVECNVSKPFLFEGETVPAVIRLFLWDRLPVTRIEQAPLKKGEAFSMPEIGQPEQKRNVSRNGKKYTVFSWPVGLTATRTGEQNLSFSATIRVRVNNTKGTLSKDPFFGSGKEEQLKVQGQEMTFDVRPLPLTGRPTGYTGAVGKFETKSELSTPMKTGAPSNLIFTIEGEGNFPFFSAPVLPTTKNFKTGVPSFVFSGDDQSGRKGELQIVYPILFKHSGPIEIPAIPFSFFNPSLMKYEDVSVPAKKPLGASGASGVVFALDLSASMLALDLSKPDQNTTRLKTAKNAMAYFFNLDRERLIGLVGFATKAQTIHFPSLNRSRLLERLTSLTVGEIGGGTGTQIGQSLGQGINLLRSIDSTGKALVLLTDGKDEPVPLHSLMTYADGARRENIKIYTIAVGSGARTRTFLFDPSTRDILRYPNGTPIVKVADYPIDKESLRKIAKETGAKFYEADSELALLKALLDIDLELSKKPNAKQADSILEKQSGFLYERLLQEAASNLENTFGSGQEDAARNWVNGVGRQYVELYFLKTRSYPESLNDLMRPPKPGMDPVVKKASALLDPWDNPYQYRYPGEENPDGFDLWTVTPDGRTIGNSY